MKSSKRAFAIILAVVALILTVTGVVIAATDSNPGGTGDALALHGKPPTSAVIDYTLSTGQAEQMTGTLNVDFTKNQASGTLSIPVGLSTTTVGVVLANDHLYLGVPSLSSVLHTPWVSMPYATPSLFGLSLEMAAPKLDFSLLTSKGFTALAPEHNGSLTTYTFTRSAAHLSTPANVPLKLPHRLKLAISVTLGSEGQIAGLAITLSSPSAHLELALTVVSYNTKVDVGIPPTRDVSPLTKKIKKTILGTTGAGGQINQLLTPQGLGALGQIHLN